MYIYGKQFENCVTIYFQHLIIGLKMQIGIKYMIR